MLFYNSKIIFLKIILPEEIRLEFTEPEEIRLEFTELEEYSTVEATPSPLFSADFGYYNYAVL